MSKVTPIDEYRKKYTYLNKKTLKTATSKDPELLVQLINDSSLQTTTRGNIIEALALNPDEKYFNLIKTFIDNESPHIRESVIYALYQYYTTDMVKFCETLSLLKQRDQVETIDEVKQTLAEIIKLAEFY